MARPEPAADLPSVVVERLVEWSDTDAAGHHHHGAVLRWVEAAEAELLRRLGVDLFGRIPRVRYEVDYRARLWFGQTVSVRLAVGRVGTSSMRYDFDVTADGVLAASGQMVVAFAGPDQPGAVPWPPEIRAALTGV